MSASPLRAVTLRIGINVCEVHQADIEGRPYRRVINCLVDSFIGCADHHQTIRGGFSTPDLSRTPIQLTHRDVRLVAREALERLALRIEAENGVGAEIAHPHLAPFIHINGVSMRLIARELVNGPALRGWIVDAEISDVPF